MNFLLLLLLLIILNKLNDNKGDDVVNSVAVEALSEDILCAYANVAWIHLQKNESGVVV